MSKTKPIQLLLLAITIFLPTLSFGQAVTRCPAASASCTAVLGTVPGNVSSGTRQTIDISQSGIQQHQVSWTSTGASGVTVVVSASTNTVTYTTLNTSTSASGTYAFTGTYASIGVTITNTSTGVTATYVGSAGLLGLNRSVAGACALTIPAVFNTAQVATSPGTAITTTTTCILEDPYVNNITNSAVTLRIQDGQGTPVIWFGGNADFSIPANSNMRINLKGIIFSSGITAIAGTGSALNLHIDGLQ